MVSGGAQNAAILAYFFNIAKYIKIVAMVISSRIFLASKVPTCLRMEESQFNQLGQHQPPQRELP